MRQGFIGAVMATQLEAINNDQRLRASYAYSSLCSTSFGVSQLIYIRLAGPASLCSLLFGLLSKARKG
jgi:hypothetical protein